MYIHRSIPHSNKNIFEWIFSIKAIAMFRLWSLLCNEPTNTTAIGYPKITLYAPSLQTGSNLSYGISDFLLSLWSLYESQLSLYSIARCFLVHIWSPLWRWNQSYWLFFVVINRTWFVAWCPSYLLYKVIVSSSSKFFIPRIHRTNDKTFPTLLKRQSNELSREWILGLSSSSSKYFPFLFVDE